MIVIDNKAFSLTGRSVVTFGKFDGIHKGHRKLFEKAREIAKAENMFLVAFTFKVEKGQGFTYMEGEKITTDKERYDIFKELGVDIVVEYPFDIDTAAMEPLNFIEEIIKNKLNAAYVVVGSDWSFGKDRAGNTVVLKAAQKLYKYEAVVLEKELYNHREISSSWIREEVAEGNMENANILLGYPYTIAGKVRHGNKLGTKMGIPTVNIIPEDEKILPPRGVYASKVVIDEQTYYGITNIGVKPTVTEENKITIETFILNFDKDVYKEDIKVQLFHFQRPEMKFGSVDALTNQIAKDIDFTKTYFML